MICCVDGCINIHHAKGFCKIHYDHERRSKAPKKMRPTFYERFNSYKNESEGCWQWGGNKNRHGYGVIGRDGKTFLAHRVSYEKHNGEIPDGMLVLHKCDNRICVNPSHLFIGTHQDNTDDRISKGRSSRGEKHCKAKLTEQDVYEVKMLLKEKKKMSEISEMFGVAVSAISAIGKKINWAWLEDEQEVCK